LPTGGHEQKHIKFWLTRQNRFAVYKLLAGLCPAPAEPNHQKEGLGSGLRVCLTLTRKERQAGLSFIAHTDDTARNNPLMRLAQRSYAKFSNVGRLF